MPISMHRVEWCDDWIPNGNLAIYPTRWGEDSNGLMDYGWFVDESGQIIATSHDLTPNGRVVGEPCLQWPYFREIQVGEIL